MAPACVWTAGWGSTCPRDTLEPVQQLLCSKMGPCSLPASLQTMLGSGLGAQGTADAASNALPTLFLGRVKFIQEI